MRAISTVLLLCTTAATSWSQSVEFEFEALARRGLNAYFGAACRKNTTAMGTALAANVTTWEADHSCYGPFDKQKTVANFGQHTFKWFSTMRRPLGQVVALNGQPGDPRGGVTFAAAFTDMGVFPNDVLNGTLPAWSFLTHSIATGSVNRDGLLTTLRLHMPWAAPGNTVMATHVRAYIEAGWGEHASAPDLREMMLPAAWDRLGSASVYSESGLENMSLRTFVERRALMIARTVGRRRVDVGGVAAGCGEAAVMVNVAAKLSGGVPEDVLQSAAHTLSFDKATGLISKIRVIEMTQKA